MTIELHQLIYNVRESLSELPSDLASDEQIYQDVKLANTYIQSVISDTFTDEDFIKSAIVSLASYFAYVNYTSLAERQFGNVPITATLRASLLKNIALSLIRMLSDVPIDDDLSLDTSQIDKTQAAGIGLVKNIWQP